MHFLKLISHNILNGCIFIFFIQIPQFLGILVILLMLARPLLWLVVCSFGICIFVQFFIILFLFPFDSRVVNSIFILDNLLIQLPQILNTKLIDILKDPLPLTFGRIDTGLLFSPGLEFPEPSCIARLQFGLVVTLSALQGTYLGEVQTHNY